METRTAGAEGGPGKRAGSNPGTALRPDPYCNAKLCCNGNEYAKATAARAGIAFTALDNGFAAVDDVAAVQEICDSFDERVICRHRSPNGISQRAFTSVYRLRGDSDDSDVARGRRYGFAG